MEEAYITVSEVTDYIGNLIAGDLNLYGVQVRDVNFASGEAPTSVTTKTQKWIPYTTSTSSSSGSAKATAQPLAEQQRLKSSRSADGT